LGFGNCLGQLDQLEIMNIALVHDYINEFGGAERVLKSLTEIWPNAPIYTAFAVKDSSAYKKFQGSKIIESKFAPLLKIDKLYSPLRFLTPAIWNSFNLKGYDVVISSASWYITKGIKITNHHSLNTIHLCYCHTPPRYLYGYKTAVEWQRYLPIRIYAYIVNTFLRYYDFKSAQKPDYFIANSQNVKRRIWKFYRRKAQVIYPPVKVAEIIKATKNLQPKDYFLIVSRVVGAKGISLAIKAANKLNVKLKIVGEPAGLRWKQKEFKKIKSKNIQFIGRVSDNELWKLYGECKAFLALAKDEDFGITPVEAMASGRPVIAFKGGGYLETVVPIKTGVFFDQQRVDSLAKAMENFNPEQFSRKDCIKQAQKFSEERFKKEIQKFVSNKLNF